MSNEQKPPQSPEQPDFPHDLRFTDERIEALKGSAELTGGAVEITAYRGTDQADDEVKHYIEYKDENNDTGYATLDQFAWTSLPAERKDELARAGMSAYDLDAGTDPILREATFDQMDSTHLLDHLIDAISEGVAGRLTGRSRQKSSSGAKTGAASPKKHKKTPKPDTRSPEEKLMASVAVRKGQRRDTANKDNLAFDLNTEASRRNQEQLDQMIEVAAIVADAMNQSAEKAREEERKRHEKFPKGQAVPNPYEPDLLVQHAWLERRPKLIRKLERNTPRIKRHGGMHENDMVEGWLLARGATNAPARENASTRPVVQEIMLGTDGKLHVYAPATLYDVSAVLHNPHSRKQICESDNSRNRMPDGGLARVAERDPQPRELHYERNTSPATQNFYTLEHGTDPTGVCLEDDIPVFADPRVIRQGLEDLIIEKDLELP